LRWQTLFLWQVMALRYLLSTHRFSKKVPAHIPSKWLGIPEGLLSPFENSKNRKILFNVSSLNFKITYSLFAFSFSFWVLKSFFSL
jgi:hypothetical protein